MNSVTILEDWRLKAKVAVAGYIGVSENTHIQRDTVNSPPPVAGCQRWDRTEPDKGKGRNP